MFLNTLLSENVVYAVDVLEPIVKWVGIGLIAALLVVALVVYLAKREIFAKVMKIELVVAVIAAVAIGLTMVSLEIAKHYSESYADKNWLDRMSLIKNVLVPIAVTLGIILIATVAELIALKVAPAKAKLVLYIGVAATLASVIVTAILISQHYTTHIDGDGYYDESEAGAKVNNVLLWLFAVILVVLAVCGAFLFNRKEDNGFTTKSIAYAAICIAMSFALSYIKLFEMPQGGSVTIASLLPLMLYSYMFGTKKGVFACFIYGILQAVQDPWIIHPAQFLLDYPIAFAFVGLAGMFSDMKALDKLPQLKFAFGAVVASSLRFVSHVLSGVFAFSAYAFDNGFTSPLLYSLGYNSFVFVDIAIVIVVGILLLSSPAIKKTVDGVRVAR
ncbi:MAG: energy-coupled thiamine transporter ThiT [Clostridia bacterium]|nr:energy-coupled thiamine transporter ThiT [Clostridia bacterium]